MTNDFISYVFPFLCVRFMVMFIIISIIVQSFSAEIIIIIANFLVLTANNC